ncbi:MAG: hypothetical protein GXP62_05690, partial [Oligoflexia bacterium]|nr:hypothetical protein [Oligoflexia bacterium]
DLPAARAKPVRSSRARTTARTTTKTTRRRTTDSGICIRCAADIVFSIDKPLCAKCYRSWSRYKNDSYKEKYCHACGEEHAATMLKPLCRGCWKDGRG